MAVDIPFAKVPDLEARWRPITDVESARALTLLEDASQLIIDEGFDVDTIAARTLTRIVCAVVKRAMSIPGGDSVTSLQQGAGPFQQTAQFANPTGDLYLTKAERRALSGGGGQQAFEITLTEGVEDLFFGPATWWPQRL